MTRFLTIMLSAFTTLALAQSDPLHGKWVAVSSRPVGDNWYSPIDGVVIDMGNKNVTIGHVFSDSTKSFPIKRKRKRIEISDREFGKIHFLSHDSLVLDFNNRMRTRFVPVNAFHPEIESLDLANNAWTLKWSEGEYSINQRIDFLDSKWRSEQDPNIAITHEKATKYKHQEAEKWALKKVHGEWFLTLTQRQTDLIVFQVAESYGDSTKLVCLSWPTGNSFLLLKNHEKGRTELEAISNYLTQKKWRTAEVLNYSSSFIEHTSDTDVQNASCYYFIDTTLISKQDFLDRKIALYFKPDFSLQIIVDDTPFFHTNWRLSKDGSYVIINDGTSPYDYIEIISIENTQLVIGKIDDFGADKKGEYFPYYYEIRLE